MTDRTDAHGWPGDDVEVPPHGLDLDAIVQAGRRQVRHRRMAMVGGTAAVLAAVAAIPATVPLRSLGGGDGDESPASSAPLPILDCDITALPLPERYAEPEPDTFPYVQPAAMDPTGRYVVGNAYVRTFMEGGLDSRSDPDGVVLWDDGQPTMPSPLQGDTTALAVNANGVVVGVGDATPGGEYATEYAWIYRDGEMSRLPTPDGYESAEANAINATGDVVGTVAEADDRQTMVLWPADDRDNPRVLTALTGRDVVASGITDDGLAIGEYYSRNAGGLSDAGVYLWEPDGTLTELPVPEGAYDVYGTAVRGYWAVAQAITEPEGPGSPPTGSSMSLRWDLRTRTLQLVSESGGVPNQVQDVNPAGDLVFAAPPAVIRDGEAYALPDPIDEGIVTPPGAAYVPYVAADSISDDGSTIAGWVDILTETPHVGSGDTHPVIWHC